MAIIRAVDAFSDGVTFYTGLMCYIATISTVLYTSDGKMGVSYVFEKLLAFSLCTIVVGILDTEIIAYGLKRIALARGTLTAAYSEQVDTLAQWYVGQVYRIIMNQ